MKSKCKIEGCLSEELTKGYCSKHYRRLWLYGDVNFKVRERGISGNGSINSNGYKVFIKDGKYILEHRQMMENFIGRKLLKDEQVHHINENRLDNRIENLKLVTQSEHNKIHTNGRILSNETRDKISKSNIGKTVSEETRLKMSKSMTGLKRTIETCEKIRKVRTGTKRTKKEPIT